MDYPIYSPLRSRAGTLARDGFMKNVFVEQTGEQSWDCFRRPGLLAYSTNTATPQTGKGIASLKDANGIEHLFVVQGGSLYAEGVVLSSSGDWTISSGTTGRIISSAGNIMHFPSFVSFRGLIFAIGGGAASAGTANGSLTRFMVAYSGDNGRNWTVLVDVASGATGFPISTRSFHACAHSDGRIYIIPYTSNDDVWYTEDGVTWTSATLAHGMAGPIERLVSHIDGLYAFQGVAANPVFKSTNSGATWASTAATAAFNVGGNARTAYAAVSFAGNLYVFGGTNNGGGQKVFRSTDNAVTWAELGTNVLSFAGQNTSNWTHAVMNGPVVFGHWAGINGLADTNRIYYSSDFQTWTLLEQSDTILFATVPTDSDHTGFLNNTFVASLTSTSVTDVYYLDVTSAGSTQVSVSSLSGEFFDFAQNYARTVITFKSESSAYQLRPQYGVVTQVTDADYPALTVRGLVYLGGKFYVMDPDGNIFNSGDEDFTTWDSTEFIASEFEPDGGVCLIKFGLYVVAFGEYSTEFFYDAGNATGSPLSPVQNGVVTVGCVDGDTVNTIDGQVIFVGQTKTQGQGPAYGRIVAQLEGTGIKKLSTHDIDRILEADDFKDIDATVFKVSGHSYYMLRLGTSNISLVFDLSTQQWYVWTTRRASFTHTLSGVVSTLGTATRTGTHSFADGDVGIISSFSGTDTALNGTFNMIVPSSTSLNWSVSTSFTGTSTTTGTVTGRTEDDFPVVSAASYQGKQLLQDKDNGSLYELDLDTFRDNGVYMDWLVRLTKLRGADNQKKFVAWVDFVSDRGSANVLMRHSDDDSQTFTKYKSRSMAGARTRWHRLGSYRERVYDLRVTDNLAVRAQHLSLMER